MTTTDFKRVLLSGLASASLINLDQSLLPP